MSYVSSSHYSSDFQSSMDKFFSKSLTSAQNDYDQGH